jgi:hypothetical protein
VKSTRVPSPGSPDASALARAASASTTSWTSRSQRCRKRRRSRPGSCWASRRDASRKLAVEESSSSAAKGAQYRSAARRPLPSADTPPGSAPDGRTTMILVDQCEMTAPFCPGSWKSEGPAGGRVGAGGDESRDAVEEAVQAESATPWSSPSRRPRPTSAASWPSWTSVTGPRPSSSPTKPASSRPADQPRQDRPRRDRPRPDQARTRGPINEYAKTASRNPAVRLAASIPRRASSPP